MNSSYPANIVMYFCHDSKLLLRFFGCKRLGGIKEEQGYVYQRRTTSEYQQLPHWHSLQVATCKHGGFSCAHSNFHGVTNFAVALFKSQSSFFETYWGWQRFYLTYHRTLLVF